MTSTSGEQRLAAVSAPSPEGWTLPNGLRVLHLPMEQAELVSTALCYRAGSAAEPPAKAGMAHFLEHMMFKGAERYGPGDIDRITQRLGGWNNAFTSHDSTVYLFDFARDSWREALAIEADRMSGLTLDPVEVESERRVILEEVSMSLDDPWDSLELAAHERLFGDHPYGRSILGCRETLVEIGEAELRGFHEAYYRPENAVLAVAGRVSRAEVEDAAALAFGSVPARFGGPSPEAVPASSAAHGERLEKVKGETSRLLIVFPGPRADSPEHAALVPALSVLTGGRVSRLQQRLVEDGCLCSRVAADISETAGCSVIAIAAEAMPGADRAEIELEILRSLEELRAHAPRTDELSRAKSAIAADWTFGLERIHSVATLAAVSEAIFDRGYPARQLKTMTTCTAEVLSRVARRYLVPGAGSVIAWSKPGSAFEAPGR